MFLKSMHQRHCLSFLNDNYKKEKEKKGYYLPSLQFSPFISLLAVRAYEGQGK